jgi:hypothetical protein
LLQNSAGQHALLVLLLACQLAVDRATKLLTSTQRVYVAQLKMQSHWCLLLLPRLLVYISAELAVFPPGASPHAVAGLLKQFLMGLHEPLLTYRCVGVGLRLSLMLVHEHCLAALPVSIQISCTIVTCHAFLLHLHPTVSCCCLLLV